jgi:uncharacterized protein (DUF2147 family)
MTGKIILFIGLCLSASIMAQKATDNFSGKWKTEEGVIIEIKKSTISFYGKPTGKNVFVLKNLTFSDGKWLGTLTNPKKNVTANCEAYLQGNKIKFVAKRGLISKEIFWTKVK